MNPAELNAWMDEHFTRSAFRLETLQTYEVAPTASTTAATWTVSGPGPPSASSRGSTTSRPNGPTACTGIVCGSSHGRSRPTPATSANGATAERRRGRGTCACLISGTVTSPLGWPAPTGGGSTGGSSKATTATGAFSVWRTSQTGSSGMRGSLTKRTAARDRRPRWSRSGPAVGGRGDRPPAGGVDAELRRDGARAASSSSAREDVRPTRSGLSGRLRALREATVPRISQTAAAKAIGASQKRKISRAGPGTGSLPRTRYAPSPGCTALAAASSAHWRRGPRRSRPARSMPGSSCAAAAARPRSRRACASLSKAPS